MIDGITVLNNVIVSDFNPVPWLCLFIGLLFVALIITYIKLDDFDKKNLLGVWWCGIFALALILLIANIRLSRTDAIQCTIEDNVSINEVYDIFQNTSDIDASYQRWSSSHSEYLSNYHHRINIVLQDLQHRNYRRYKRS